MLLLTTNANAGKLGGFPVGTTSHLLEHSSIVKATDSCVIFNSLYYFIITNGYYSKVLKYSNGQVYKLLKENSPHNF